MSGILNNSMPLVPQPGLEATRYGVQTPNSE